MKAGEFDDLEGKGRPINLDAYFSTPEELRAGYAVLKNAGVLPEEAGLLSEINELQARLEGCRDAAGRGKLVRSIGGLTLKYNLLAERPPSKRRSGSTASTS